VRPNNIGRRRRSRGAVVRGAHVHRLAPLRGGAVFQGGTDHAVTVSDWSSLAPRAYELAPP